MNKAFNVPIYLIVINAGHPFTMSEFASFVAATLRDKAMTDFLEENKTLRQANHALNFVEITGPDYHPVYARGHLSDGDTILSDQGEVLPSLWGVEMKQLAPCPLKDLASIEIWARGCCIVDDVNPDGNSAQICDFCIEESIRDGRAHVAFAFESIFIRMVACLTQAELDGARALTNVGRFHSLTQMDHIKTCTFEAVFLKRNKFGLICNSGIVVI